MEIYLVGNISFTKLLSVHPYKSSILNIITYNEIKFQTFRKRYIFDTIAQIKKRQYWLKSIPRDKTPKQEIVFYNTCNFCDWR